MAGIGVIVNPKSRRNLRRPNTVDSLRRRVDGVGVVRAAHSIDEIDVIASDFRRDGVDVVAISGGDGTNTVTLSRLRAIYGDAALPWIALLRGGTMNTTARSIGIVRGGPEELLGRIARRYHDGGRTGLATVERDLMNVRSLDEPQGRAAFLFGTGVVHGFLDEYYRRGASSPTVAARTLASGIGSAMTGGDLIRRMAAPFRGTVTLDDGTVWPERDYLAVAAGTIAHIGLGFRPFHRSTERPGSFHVLGIHTSPLGFVAELPRIHTERPMRDTKTYSAVAPRMLVEGAGGAVRYMIDGDLHEAPGALEITVPGRVALVLPR